MTHINSFRDLRVWQYRFIFCNQLLRSAISIPSNIAEGTRRPTGAYLNHLSISLGSEAEVETLVEIIRRRNLAAESLLVLVDSLMTSSAKMLHALVNSVEQSANQNR